MCVDKKRILENQKNFETKYVDLLLFLNKTKEKTGMNFFPHAIEYYNAC